LAGNRRRTKRNLVSPSYRDGRGCRRIYYCGATRGGPAAEILVMETASLSPQLPQSRPRISALPRAVRDELNRRLLKGNLSSYSSLSQWLKDQGYQISPRSLAKYGNKLERRLETVKMATEQARAVVDMTEGDDATLNEALLRLVQQHLFA